MDGHANRGRETDIRMNMLIQCERQTDGWTAFCIRRNANGAAQPAQRNRRNATVEYGEDFPATGNEMDAKIQLLQTN